MALNEVVPASPRQPRRSTSRSRPLSAGVARVTKATTSATQAIVYSSDAGVQPPLASIIEDRTPRTELPEGADGSLSWGVFGARPALYDPLNFERYEQDIERQISAKGSRSDDHNPSCFSTVDVSRINKKLHSSQRLDTFNTPSKLGRARAGQACDVALGTGDLVKVLNALRDDIATAIELTIRDLGSELAIESRETLQSLRAEIQNDLATLRSIRSEHEQMFASSKSLEEILDEIKSFRDETSNNFQRIHNEKIELKTALLPRTKANEADIATISSVDNQLVVQTFSSAIVSNISDSLSRYHEGCSKETNEIVAEQSASVAKLLCALDLLAKQDNGDARRCDVVGFAEAVSSRVVSDMSTLLTRYGELGPKQRNDILAEQRNLGKIASAIETLATRRSAEQVGDYDLMAKVVSSSIVSNISNSLTRYCETVNKEMYEILAEQRAHSETTLSALELIAKQGDAKKAHVVAAAEAVSSEVASNISDALSRYVERGIEKRNEILTKQRNIVATISDAVEMLARRGNTEEVDVSDLMAKAALWASNISDSFKKCHESRNKEVNEVLAEQSASFSTILSRLELLAKQADAKKVDVVVVAEAVSSAVATHCLDSLTRCCESGIEKRNEILAKQRNIVATMSDAVEMLARRGNAEEVDESHLMAKALPWASNISDSFTRCQESRNEEVNEILAEQSASFSTILSRLELLVKQVDAKKVDVVAVAEAVSSAVASHCLDSLTRSCESGIEKRNEILTKQRNIVATISDAVEMLTRRGNTEEVDESDLMAKAVSCASNISDSFIRCHESRNKEVNEILAERSASFSTILSRLELLAKQADARKVDVVALAEAVSAAVASHCVDSLTRCCESAIEKRNETLTKQRNIVATISDAVELLATRGNTEEVDESDWMPKAVSWASNISDSFMRCHQSGNKEVNEILAEQSASFSTILFRLELLAKQADAKKVDVVVVAEAVSSAVASHCLDSLTRCCESQIKTRSEILEEQRANIATILSGMEALSENVETMVVNALDVSEVVTQEFVANVSDLLTRYCDNSRREIHDVLTEQRASVATMSFLQLLAKHRDTALVEEMTSAGALSSAVASKVSDSLTKWCESRIKERNEILVEQNVIAATISSAVNEMKDAIAADAMSQLTGLIWTQAECQNAKLEAAFARFSAELRSCVGEAFDAKVLAAAKAGTAAAIPPELPSPVDGLGSRGYRADLACSSIAGQEVTTKADLEMALEELRLYLSVVLAAVSESPSFVGDSTKTHAMSQMGRAGQSLVEVSSKGLISSGSSGMFAASRSTLIVAPLLT